MRALSPSAQACITAPARDKSQPEQKTRGCTLALLSSRKAYLTERCVKLNAIDNNMMSGHESANGAVTREHGETTAATRAISLEVFIKGIPLLAKTCRFHASSFWSRSISKNLTSCERKRRYGRVSIPAPRTTICRQIITNQAYVKSYHRQGRAIPQRRSSSSLWLHTCFVVFAVCICHFSTTSSRNFVLQAKRSRATVKPASNRRRSCVSAGRNCVTRACARGSQIKGGMSVLVVSHCLQKAVYRAVSSTGLNLFRWDNQSGGNMRVR